MRKKSKRFIAKLDVKLGIITPEWRKGVILLGNRCVMKSVGGRTFFNMLLYSDSKKIKSKKDGKGEWYSIHNSLIPFFIILESEAISQHKSYK